MTGVRWVDALLVVLLVLGAALGRAAHPHFWWDSIPALGALIGLGGTWLLVWLAKSVLAPRLERREDYYQG
jgi:hypothetical protein